MTEKQPQAYSWGFIQEMNNKFYCLDGLKSFFRECDSLEDAKAVFDEDDEPVECLDLDLLNQYYY